MASSSNVWAEMAGVQPAQAPTGGAHPSAAYPTMQSASPALIRSIIHAESHGDPDAVSNKGARGLMQIEPSTAASLGVNPRDLNNPTINMEAGRAYVNQMLARFHGDPRLAMAAYNAGPTTIANLQARYGPRYEDIAPHLPPETQAYVPKVLGSLAPSAAAAEPPQNASSPSAAAENVWAQMAGMPAPGATPSASDAPTRSYPSDVISKGPLTVPTMPRESTHSWYTNLGIGALRGLSDVGNDLLGALDTEDAQTQRLTNRVMGAQAPAGPDLWTRLESALGVDPVQRQLTTDAYNNMGHSIARPIGNFLGNAVGSAPIAMAGAEALGAIPGVSALGNLLVNTDPETGGLVSRIPFGRMLYRAGEGAGQGAIMGALAPGHGMSRLQTAAAGAALGAPTGAALGWLGPRVAQGLGWVGDKIGGYLPAARQAAAALGDQADEVAAQRAAQAVETAGVGAPPDTAAAAQAAAVPDAAATPASQVSQAPLARLLRVPVKGGPEAFAEALDRYHVNPEELTPDHLTTLEKVSAHIAKAHGDLPTPEVLARTANLQANGISPTAAMVMRDPESWAQEDYLRSSPAGQPLQQRYLKNNYGVVQRFQALRDAASAGGSGVPMAPHEVGQQVIDAVNNGWDESQKAVGAKYDLLRNAYGDQPGAYPNHLTDALDSFKGITGWDEMGNAVRNRMQRLGYLDSDGNVPLDDQDNPKPMTVGQSVELRKFLTQLPQVSPTARYGARQLTNALDDDLSETATPDANDAVRDAIGSARARFAKYRDGGLVQQIVDGKAAPDNLMKTVLGIGRGPASREALQNLQSVLSETPEGQATWANVRGQGISALQNAARAGLPDAGIASPTTVRNIAPASLRNELSRQSGKADILYGTPLWSRLQSLSQAVDDGFTPPAGDVRNMSRTAPALERSIKRNMLMYTAGHPLGAAAAVIHGGITGAQDAAEANALLRPEKAVVGNKVASSLLNNLGLRSLPVNALVHRLQNAPSGRKLAEQAGGS